MGNAARRGAGLLCAIVGLGPWAGAQAQTAADPQQGGEIVVTATRQSAPLSKVPLSVSALNEKALDQRGVKGIEDISALTPGVTFTANGFGAQADIAIRGIDSQVGSATTGIYVDDTPIQTRVVGYSATNTYPLVFDLDRIEVLRGPQGTLFGSGAEGGAVRFITPAPSLDHASAYGRGEVSATQGGAASGEIGMAVGAPIVPGQLGIRASVWVQHLGGYIDRKNLNPAITGPSPVDRNANRADAVVGRFALGWRPAEAVTVTPSILLQDRKIHDIGTFWEGYEAQNGGRLVNGQPLAQPDHDHFLLPALRIEVALPTVRLVSNTSFFHRVEQATDDYSTLIPAIFTPPLNYVAGDSGYAAFATMRNVQSAWTEELRAESASKTAPLSWVAGLFLASAKQSSFESITDPKFAEVLGAPPQDVLGLPLIDNTYSLIAGSDGKDRQAALFGELNYRLTDRLKATAGLRIARATFIGQGRGTGAFIGTTIVNPSSSTTETPVTPKFALSFQATADTLLYASAAKGYRIGGTNSPLSDFCNIAGQGYASVPAAYQSDSLWSYEAGAKSRLFDRHLDVAASAYHVNWSNIQQLVYISNCGQQFVDNIGKAKSEGFDLQVAARPLAGLTLEGAIGYTRAVYTRTIPLLVQAGNHIDTQPWSGTLGVTYEHGLGRAVQGYARLDYTWHSRSGITPALDRANGSYDPAALPTPQTQLANLRAGARLGRFDISAFANNLFDSRPLLTRYSEVIGNPVHRDFTFRPRTLGLTVTYRD